MAVTFFTGFETGDLSEVQSIAGGASIVSSPVQAGGYAAQLPTNGGEIFYTSGSPAYAALGFRQWVRISTLPSGADPRIYGAWYFGDDTGMAAGVHILSDGTLQIQSRLALTGSDTSTYTLAPDTWYEGMLAYDKAAGGIIKFWIRAATESSPTLALSVTHAAAGTDIVQVLGANAVNGTATLYVDSALIVDTATQPPSGQSIARQGKAGAPNADTWTKTSSQTAAQVWSATPFSATNEAHSTDQSQAQTMLVDDVGAGTDPIGASDTINACKVVIIAKEIRAATGTPTYSIRRRLNSSDTDTARALTTSDALYDDGIWTDTRANLQSAEIGGVRGSGIDTTAFVSAGTEGSAGSGNVTPGLPASIAANDILICVVHSTDQVAHSMNGTYWTQIVQGDGGGSTSHLSAWWHRYDGSTDPDRIVTHTSGDTIVSGIAAFRGCRRDGSPIDSSSAINAGTDSSMETNGVSPTVDGCMLLLLHGAGNDNNVTVVSTYAAAFEDTGGGTQNSFQSTTGTDGMVGLQYLRQVTKAATGTVTVTQGASNAWATAMVALAPAATQMQIEDAWLMVDYTVVAAGAGKPMTYYARQFGA